MVAALGATEAARMPAEAVLRVLRRTIEAAILRDGGRDLGRRELRRAPFVLWDAELSTDVGPRLRDLVLLQAASSDATLRNLIDAWLMRFDASRSEMRATGAAIATLLPKTRDQRLAAWAQASRRFLLFDPAEGPVSFGRHLLGDAGETNTLLAEAGFNDPLRAQCDYLRAVQHEMLAMAPAAFRIGFGPTAAARLIEFLAPARELRFRETRPLIGKGLLRAWLDGGVAPSELVRDVDVTSCSGFSVIREYVRRTGPLSGGMRPRLYADGSRGPHSRHSSV